MWCHRFLAWRFSTSSFERCSGRKFLLRLVGKEVDESRAAFFINVVKVETAESISSVDFKEMFRDILFSTMRENFFQSVIPGVRVGNFFSETN